MADVKWNCPMCSAQDGLIEAPSDTKLFWLVRAHIQQHMDTAALRMADDLKGHCQCNEFARKRNIPVDSEGLPALSHYDRTWLKGNKTKW